MDGRSVLTKGYVYTGSVSSGSRPMQYWMRSVQLHGVYSGLVLRPQSTNFYYFFAHVQKIMYETADPNQCHISVGLMKCPAFCDCLIQITFYVLSGTVGSCTQVNTIKLHS